MSISLLRGYLVLAIFLVGLNPAGHIIQNLASSDFGEGPLTKILMYDAGKGPSLLERHISL